MLDDLLTVPDAAVLLGITPASVRSLIMRGVLVPVRRIGKSNLLLKTDVLAYQASRAGKAKPGPAPGRRRQGAAPGEAAAA